MWLLLGHVMALSVAVWSLYVLESLEVRNPLLFLPPCPPSFAGKDDPVSMSSLV
jgi:hypothetical protein